MSIEQPDPDLVEQTKNQIRNLVREIAQLSRSDMSPAEFYDAFLTRVVAALAAGAVRADVQVLPRPDDTRSSMLRAAMLGLLPGQPAISLMRSQHDCLALPVDPPNDRLEGPHGDILIMGGDQCYPQATREEVATAAQAGDPR